MTIEQLFGHDQSEVSEDHFEKVFGTLHEGVHEGAANECEVVASGPAAMTVEVRTGTFVTGGVFARVSAQDVLVIGVADPVNPRIDRIVCRRDNATDLVTVYVLAGVAAGAPVPPVLTRAGGIWEISLAQVLVGAAVVVINTGDITDERSDYAVCGWTGQNKQAPAARVYNSGAQATVSGVPLTLPFNNERYDTDSIWTVAPNPTRLTAQTPGKYSIKGNAGWLADPVNAVIEILLNGVTTVARQGLIADYRTMIIGTDYDLAAGDYVELVVTQTSGGPINIVATGNYSPEFMMYKFSY